ITVDVSGLTDLTTVAAAINAAVDADVQVHADGSAIFSPGPNNLASVVTYGTQELLKIEGRNVQSALNGLSSNVRILTPTTGGETDASSKLGFTPNQTSTGSQNALNQAAHIYSANVGPYNITNGVDDTFLFNVDSQDVAAS